MQLNMRHTTAKALPAVARMEKMTVTERCTNTTSSLGTPSYGIRPPGRCVKYGSTRTNMLHFFLKHADAVALLFFVVVGVLVVVMLML